MHFFYLLKLDVLKNCVLEGSGLDFGGPRARFWKVLGHQIAPGWPQGLILEAPGLDFGGSGTLRSRFSDVFEH